MAIVRTAHQPDEIKVLFLRRVEIVEKKGIIPGDTQPCHRGLELNFGETNTSPFSLLIFHLPRCVTHGILFVVAEGTIIARLICFRSHVARRTLPYIRYTIHPNRDSNAQNRVAVNFGAHLNN